MNFARKLLNAIFRVEKLIALTAFSVMTIILIADVALRKFTGTGIAGAARMAVFAMIAAAVVSFGLASHKGRHLRPKFTDGWFPPHWNIPIHRVQEASTALFCLAFAVIATGVVMETNALGETSRMLRIPIWPIQALIPLTFYIGALRHTLHAIYPELRPNHQPDGEDPRVITGHSTPEAEKSK